MAKIQSGQAIDLVTLSKAEAKVGDYKWSALPVVEFEDEHLGSWKLCNGQSCAGTLYQTITGNATVPDSTTDGTFIRAAKSGRILGSTEADSMQGHGHDLYVGNTSSGFAHGNANNQIALADVAGGRVLKSAASGSQDLINAAKTDGVNGTPRIANETRPKNIALNLYVKVGY